jgi:hypothetical protein
MVCSNMFDYACMNGDWLVIANESAVELNAIDFFLSHHKNKLNLKSKVECHECNAMSENYLSSKFKTGLS